MKNAILFSDSEFENESNDQIDSIAPSLKIKNLKMKNQWMSKI